MKEEEFIQLIGSTKLSNKTRDAARQVLVDGRRQVDVCNETGMSPKVLSRAISVLTKKAEAQQDNGENVLSISRAEAVKQVRDLLGDSILVRNAPDNGTTIGKVLLRTDYHLVQDIGKNQVMVHELSKIDRVPPMNKSVELKYQQGFAELKSRELSQERGGR